MADEVRRQLAASDNEPMPAIKFGAESAETGADGQRMVNFYFTIFKILFFASVISTDGMFVADAECAP